MRHEKLRKRIKDKGYEHKQIASKIGIDACTMSRKLSGIQPFKWQEVLALCEVLDIANPIGWFE